MLRKASSIVNTPPIKEMINVGIIDILVKYGP
jgi:hypothetical protein